MLSLPSIAYLYEIFKQHPQVQTDTRKLQKGNIYFALKGPSFNGNSFAEKALEAGASYAVVDEQVEVAAKWKDKILLVEDSLSCLH